MVFPIGAAMNLMNGGHMQRPQQQDGPLWWPPPEDGPFLRWWQVFLLALLPIGLTLIVFLVVDSGGGGADAPSGYCSTGTHVTYVHHGKSTTSYCVANR